MAKKITLSIVIPTWNEEKYLPRLLNSIKKQNYETYEIIIADADSKDKTRKIAKNYGCKVVKGGMPAVGRNNGAKNARGEIILFLDADSEVENDFIENALANIKEKNIDVAGSYLYPSTNKILDKIFLSVFNLWIFLTQYFYPNACGTGVFCKKWLHEKIKGFDKSVKLGEDMDYVKRAGKFGKFGIIENSRVIYSMRRYENEGRLNVGLKLFLSAAYRLIFGEIRTDAFNYNLKYKK